MSPREEPHHHLLATSTDERAEIEEALSAYRRADERYKTIVDSAPSPWFDQLVARADEDFTTASRDFAVAAERYLTTLFNHLTPVNPTTKETS